MRFAIMLPNLLQYATALLGALRAGLTVVSTNLLYTPRELEHQLRNSGATAMVVLENSAHVLASCMGRTAVRQVIMSKVGDMLPLPRRLPVNAVVEYVRGRVPADSLPDAVPFRRALERGADLTLRAVDVGPDDLAFRLVDRQKDMILVSGFNDYPNEVKAVIAAHPNVTDVGVIGVADAGPCGSGYPRTLPSAADRLQAAQAHPFRH